MINEAELDAAAIRRQTRIEPVSEELIRKATIGSMCVHIHRSCRYRGERHHVKVHQAADGRFYVIKGRERHYLTECVVENIDGHDLLHMFKTDHPRW